MQPVLFNSCQAISRVFGVERLKDTDITVLKDQPTKITLGLKKSQEKMLQQKTQVFSH